MPGTGICGYEKPRSLPVSSTCTAIAVLDSNGDGHLDLAFGAASEVDEFTGVGDTFTSVGVVAGNGAQGTLHVVGVRGDAFLPAIEFERTVDIDGDGLVDAMGILSDKSGRAAAAYGVKGALWANRTTFVIDEKGVIAAIFEGKDAIDPGPTVAACKPRPVSS